MLTKAHGDHRGRWRRVSSRTWGSGLAIAVALAVAVFFLSPGGDGPSAPERRATNKALADASAIGSLEAEAELERRSQALGDRQERSGGGDGFDAGIDRVDDLGWRAFDEQFRKTPFDKAIDELPLRKPPLNVVQWVTDRPPDKLASEAERERFYRMPDRARTAAVKRFYRSAPHKLYARVDRERFYRMSVRAREAAVKAFYRDALPRMKKAGIKDFVLVVTPWTETTKELPALAVGRGDSARLTPLGSADASGS